MSVRRCVLLVSIVLAWTALATTVGVAPGRGADPGDGQLVIRGDRTAYVDVTLVRPTTEPIGFRGWAHADYSSEGSYALYTLRPLGWTGPRSAGMMLRGWQDDAYDAYFSDTSDNVPLSAGTYRLYLITDGRTEFRVTLPGYGDTIVASPHVPFAATAEFIELGPGVEQPPVTHRRRFHRGDTTYGLMGAYVRAGQPVAEQKSELCITAAGATCDDTDYRSPFGSVVFGPDPTNPSRHGWVTTVMGIRPEATPPFGDVEAVWTLSGANVATRRSLVFIAADLPTGPAPTEAGQVPSGYWLAGADGSVYAFGDATFHGHARTGAPTTDIERTPSGAGYWVVDEAGNVSTFGDAAHHGHRPSLAPGERVTAMTSTATGAGYWLFTTAGRVITYGDARHYGDMAGRHLNGPVLDAIPTITGSGYYMVASDGGIFTFGDARFQGSMGGTRLNAPVQSLVPDPDGDGYWLVASDGGIFTFSAPFYGSMGGTRLNRPVTGMVGQRAGYLMVAEDGGIFTFGDARFHGSLGARPPASPVVSTATR